MANIKDVAEEAGVSIASVSRVLHSHPHVSDEMRERVQEAVAKLDYRPNLVARSLRSQQSATIGLIVSDIRNPFFTDVSRAVEDRAHEEGFSLFLCNTDEDPAKERLYLKAMKDEGVGGIIFSPTRESAEQFLSLQIDFPLVVIDRTVEGAHVDMVLLDNEEAGYRLARHLLDRGHRRLAGVFGEASTTGYQRCRGMELALKEEGLKPVKVVYTEPRIEAGYRVVQKLLSNGKKPDAILATNSLTTAGAYQALQSLGVAIPEEIALAGFDETTWTTMVDPPVTVIAQPTYEIGRTAADLLLQRIADPQRPTRSVLLKGSLLVRDSTGVRQKTDLDRYHS